MQLLLTARKPTESNTLLLSQKVLEMEVFEYTSMQNGKQNAIVTVPSFFLNILMIRIMIIVQIKWEQS